MTIESTTDIDEAEYARFLDSCASRPGTALAYHYPFYMRFLTATAYPASTPRFVIARGGDGAVAGVMPGIHVRTARLNVWLSLAYFGPNAGALVPAASGARADVVRRLVAAAHDDARERECGSLTVYTPLGAEVADYHSGLDGASFTVAREAQCLPIPADSSTSPWPRKVRYDIRRASSLGVTVRPIGGEAELDEVWDIYREGCDAAGAPIKPRDHVRALYRTAGSHGLFLLAEHQGGIVAGLVGLMGAGVLSYYLPCTRASARPLQPGLLLLDHAVSAAREAGCRLLNFESSPGAGGPVHAFKARCGGEPVPYHVLVKLLQPGAFDDYRAMAPAGLQREAPHAFVVPFESLT